MAVLPCNLEFEFFTLGGYNGITFLKHAQHFINQCELWFYNKYKMTTAIYTVRKALSQSVHFAKCLKDAKRPLLRMSLPKVHALLLVSNYK